MCDIVKSDSKGKKRAARNESEFFGCQWKKILLIAAIKSPEDLKECCGIPEIRIVFILYGDICSLGEIVKAVKDAGKIAMVHVDLIGGLSTREVAVDLSIPAPCRWDHYHETLPDPKSQRIVHVYRPQIFPSGFHGI